MNNEPSVIYECPLCFDMDCKLNCFGLCNDITTITDRIPSKIYTCGGAVIDFQRNDYL